MMWGYKSNNKYETLNYTGSSSKDQLSLSNAQNMQNVPVKNMLIRDARNGILTKKDGLDAYESSSILKHGFELKKQSTSLSE